MPNARIEDENDASNLVSGPIVESREPKDLTSQFVIPSNFPTVVPDRDNQQNEWMGILKVEHGRSYSVRPGSRNTKGCEKRAGTV